MKNVVRLTKSEEERIRVISSYIANHLHEKLSLDKLSKLFWINKKKINGGFHHVYGMAVHKYIVKTRMELAMFMLRNSNKLVKEIAGACGYKDLTGFGRTFKKFYGKSPDHYREGKIV